jgi:hypothetical protein
VRPPGDCVGLQINDETTARCRSFSFMTEVKARAPLRYRNSFSPLVSWCISAIVVGMKTGGETRSRSASDAMTSPVVAKVVVVPHGVYLPR